MVVTTAKTYTRVRNFWIVSGDDELSKRFFLPKPYSGKTVSADARKEYDGSTSRGGSTGLGPLGLNQVIVSE
jgi:hypothetical protein